MICEQCKRPVLFRLVGNGECVCRVCGRLHRIDDHLENEQQAAYVSRLEAAYVDMTMQSGWDTSDARASLERIKRGEQE